MQYLLYCICKAPISFSSLRACVLHVFHLPVISSANNRPFTIISLSNQTARKTKQATGGSAGRKLGSAQHNRPPDSTPSETGFSLQTIHGAKVDVAECPADPDCLAVFTGAQLVNTNMGSHLRSECLQLFGCDWSFALLILGLNRNIPVDRGAYFGWKMSNLK